MSCAAHANITYIVIYRRSRRGRQYGGGFYHVCWSVSNMLSKMTGQRSEISGRACEGASSSLLQSMLINPSSSTSIGAGPLESPEPKMDSRAEPVASAAAVAGPDAAPSASDSSRSTPPSMGSPRMAKSRVSVKRRSGEAPATPLNFAAISLPGCANARAASEVLGGHLQAAAGRQLPLPKSMTKPGVAAVSEVASSAAEGFGAGVPWVAIAKRPEAGSPARIP